VWFIENGELSVHGYGYTEFRRRRAESQAQGKKADVKNQSAAQSVPSKPKRSSAPSRDTEAKRQVLELEIEALEQKIQDIEQALVAASEAADSPMISSLGIEHEQSQQALTEKYGAWNALSEDQGD
jgi:ATPase subunit of ABC transporter with duplicated ATPase domains